MATKAASSYSDYKSPTKKASGGSAGILSGNTAILIGAVALGAGVILYLRSRSQGPVSYGPALTVNPSTAADESTVQNLINAVTAIGGLHQTPTPTPNPSPNPPDPGANPPNPPTAGMVTPWVQLTPGGPWIISSVVSRTLQTYGVGTVAELPDNVRSIVVNQLRTNANQGSYLGYSSPTGDGTKPGTVDIRPILGDGSSNSQNLETTNKGS